MRVSYPGVFTLTSQDGNGNPAAVDQDTVFGLTSNSTGTATFYSDASGTVPISQVTIPNGTSTATLFYKDTLKGTPTVTTSRTGGMPLGSATHQITVNSGTASKVNLTGPSAVNAGVVSGVTLTSQDGNGNPAAVDQDTVFGLTSNSTGTATFYSDASGTVPISQVTIPNGTSTATLFYKDTLKGTPTVTANRTGGMPLGSATHQITVNSGTASKVNLTGPSAVNAGVVSGVFTLTSQDGNGNPAAVDQDTVFGLTSNSTGTATFYSDASGTVPISQVTIPNGTSTATLFYKDTLKGTPTVTANRTGGMPLGSATHQITVNSGTASKVNLTGPSAVNAGDISGIFTLASRDDAGNIVNVTQDTVFSLGTSSSGMSGFYKDATGKLNITHITIPSGNSAATFYYRDWTGGTATVTAARTSGMALGSANHLITVEAGMISGAVFEDFNGNGKQDAGEPGIAGVSIKLLNNAGAVLKTTTTAQNGHRTKRHIPV